MRNEGSVNMYLKVHVNDKDIPFNYDYNKNFDDNTTPANPLFKYTV